MRRPKLGMLTSKLVAPTLPEQTKQTVRRLHHNTDRSEAQTAPSVPEGVQTSILVGQMNAGNPPLQASEAMSTAESIASLVTCRRSYCPSFLGIKSPC